MNGMNMNGMNHEMMKMNNGSGMGNMNMHMKVSIACLFFLQPSCFASFTSR